MTSAEAEHVEFGILGALEVRTGGRPVPMRQGLTRAVLLSLLLRANQTVSTDVLIDDLYGEDLPAHPLNALQVQVSYLRKVLADAGAADLLRTEGAGYRLVLEPTAVDASCFETLVSRARRSADVGTSDALQAAVEDLDQALALWRGTPLEDVAYRDFAAAEIARLDELRLVARELSAEVQLALGHHREVIPDLAALAEEQPLRERVHQLLMLALYRTGRQTDALREYEATRQALAEGLGLDPGPEIRHLERAILDQDSSLDWAPPPGHVPDSRPPVAGQMSDAAPLPAPISGLVGRTKELVEIRGLLERSRAVTLTGPGGSGKTRLAIEHAHGSDGARWFVDLGPVSDRATVFSEIATAFGVTIRTSADDVSGITALGPTGLLILDTCEHVVEAAADVVAALLYACPGLRVLATSRRPLEVAGELVCPVPPLGLPDPESYEDETAVRASPAVQLFLERAQSAHPDFALTGDNAALVAAICRALDGLPLSLELAAARLDVLTPAQLHRRLDDRFALLNTGSRAAAARQQTLRAALDWSYELLTGEERQMFQRLAALPGPFRIDLACSMVDGVVTDPVELLRSLVRQSMLTRHDAEQFAVLDTLQAYARERSNSRETHEALKALTAWAVAVADERDRQARGAGQLEALAALRSDLPNLRAALEWSLGERGDPQAGAAIAGRLGWFWHLTGMYEEGYRWSVEASAVEDARPAVHVIASIGAGLHATALGLLDEARVFLDDAVATAEKMGLPGFEPRALAHRGDMEWWFDDPEAAEADLSAAALASAPGMQANEPWVRAFAQLHLGRVRLRQQRYDEATDLFDDAHAIVEEIGDIYLGELELRFRARGASLEGDPARAIGLGQQALAKAEQLGHTEGIAISLLAIGEAKREAGDRDGAASVLRQAVEFSVAADHIGSVCQALALLAAIEADSGNRARSKDLLQALLRAQKTAGLPILTPGGVVQDLVADLLDGKYPAHPDAANATAAQGRADLRALALAYLA